MNYQPKAGFADTIDGALSPRLFTPKQASQILGVAVATLAKMRRTKTGPRYAKIGKSVKYSWTDLQAFIVACQIG